ncbi:protoporphyrinogen oxidase HemJ [Lichenihabitans sp. PAMC28606]|uniref:protoporphyrinogen oxidase HemJ n=1 Tax=Lichenihabitans sp. PAMC28606 TaxID=2880932 RepID=UPI001D0BBD6B|nr:protoporphyrinogen oxidase HemJ [Lichenihabitans sp. PAMC28606]UDL93539.1 protoporphyrinogen oxidase HemJ [Lichenihabitans sp. PAMC28606]
MYLWIKALHVISMVAWMAGMLYLPRLFVYHVEAGPRTPQSETFKIMERRLLRAIMNPAMIAVWITGLWLAYEGGWFRDGWLHGKILLVVLLSGCHGFLAASTRRFANDANVKSSRYFRVVNEIPTVLLIGIVILVIVKPF